MNDLSAIKIDKDATAPLVSARDFWNEKGPDFYDVMYEGKYYMKYDKKTNRLLIGDAQSGKIIGFYHDSDLLVKNPLTDFPSVVKNLDVLASEASPKRWLDELRNSNLSESGKKKLESIARTQKTARGTQKVIEDSGGRNFRESKSGAPKIVSNPQKATAEFRALKGDSGLPQQDPGVKQSVTIANVGEAEKLLR